MPFVTVGLATLAGMAAVALLHPWLLSVLHAIVAAFTAGAA